MNSGWIKLHRQFRESPYYKIGASMQTWIECLLRATHEPHDVFLKREKVHLEPGQFVMGRREFGESIGISGSTAWYWLLQFKADSMVDITVTSKGSLVTLKNWKQYQKPDSTSDQKKTASEPHLEPYKNGNNVKNENNTVDSEILKWLRTFDSIETPEGYLRGLLKKYKREAIDRAWKKAKQGAGVEDPVSFHTHCAYWNKKL